jgi:hypothetical protein
VNNQIQLRAFHGDPAIKEKYIARVRAHRLADEIVQRVGADTDKDGKFHGCSVGCTLDRYDHRLYPVELGIPVELAHIQDAIHERLPDPDFKMFPEQYLTVIVPGAVLSNVQFGLGLWIINNDSWGLRQYIKDAETLKLIDQLGDLYDRTARSGLTEEISKSALDLARDRDRDLDLALARARALDLDRALALDLDRARALARDREDEYWRACRDQLLSLLSSAPVPEAEKAHSL